MLILLQALTTSSTRLKMIQTSFSVHTRRCLNSPLSRNNNRTPQLLGIYFPIIDVVFVNRVHRMDYGSRPHQKSFSPTRQLGQSRDAKDNMAGCKYSRPREKEKKNTGRRSEREPLRGQGSIGSDAYVGF